MGHSENPVQDVKPAAKTKGMLLTISDLHFTSSIDEENEAFLLISDLKTVYFDNPQSCINPEDIDYIIISGDFTRNGSDEVSFIKAFNFINIISGQLKVPFEKVIIVPGNHDLSWDITMNSYHMSIGIPSGSDKIVSSIGNNTFYLKKNNEEWKNKFMNFSTFLYEKLYKVPYPKDAKKQINVIEGDFIENTKIAFFMINTAAKTDHFNIQRRYFNVETLISAAKNLSETNMIKILVAHHPLDLLNNYNDEIEFANALQSLDFKIYLHGHLHRSISLSHLDCQNINPNIVMLGSGSLISHENKSYSAAPQRYNILKIEKASQAGKITVAINTRERKYIGCYWQPAYIYYNEINKSLCNTYISTI